MTRILIGRTNLIDSSIILYQRPLWTCDFLNQYHVVVFVSLILSGFQDRTLGITISVEQKCSL